MSNSDLKTTRRRRWSFEKGRYSRTAWLAAVVSLFSVTFFLSMFKYENHVSPEKEQRAAVSTLNPVIHANFLQMLDRRDPAQTYGVTGGSFTALYPERQYTVDLNLNNDLPIPQYEAALPEVEFKPGNFPVSAKFPDILPVPTSPPAKRQSPRVTDQYGKELAVDKLAAIKNRSAGECIVHITGEKLLLRSEILRSSGDKMRDMQAAQILKSAVAIPGTYIINWSGE